MSDQELSYSNVSFGIILLEPRVTHLLVELCQNYRIIKKITSSPQKKKKKITSQYTGILHILHTQAPFGWVKHFQCKMTQFQN